MQFNIDEAELKDLIKAKWDANYSDCVLERFEEFSNIFKGKMVSVEENFEEIVEHCMDEAVDELMCT